MEYKIEVTENIVLQTSQEDLVEKPEIENLVEEDENFLIKSYGNLRVATYNILTSFSYPPKENNSPENYRRSWEFRKTLILEMIKKLNLDILNLQEVSIEQFKFFKENLKDFDMVGYAAFTGHALNEIAPDEYVGEIVPILYNKKTVECIDSKVFWLSQTPGELSKGWDASRSRILTAAAFRIKQDGVKIVVGNTHYDHLGDNTLVNSGIVEAEQLEKYKEFHNASDIIYTGDRNCFTDRGRRGNEWYRTIKQKSGAEDTRVCGDHHVGMATTFIGFHGDQFKAPYYPETGKFEPNTLDLIFHKKGRYKTQSSKNASGEYAMKNGVAHLLPFFSKTKEGDKRQFASDHTCVIADFGPINPQETDQKTNYHL